MSRHVLWRHSVVHWDVNNEQLHGQFFETSSGNPWILSYMFLETRARDSDVTLFLNDYNIVSSGVKTQVRVWNLLKTSLKVMKNFRSLSSRTSYRLTFSQYTGSSSTEQTLEVLEYKAILLESQISIPLL